jgi:hypothetical protein
MSEASIKLQLSPSNPYCSGTFSHPEVRIAPGKSQVVKFKVQLGPKTPSEQAQQPQTFEVQIQPEWLVGNQPVSGPALLVVGEYKHESQWIFIARHPWLVAGGVFILVVLLLWNVFILNLIQNGLLLQLDKVSPTGTPINTVRVEQNVLTDYIQSNNPVATFAQVQVRFLEENQLVEINLKNLLISEKLVGKLEVDSAKGDLSFKSGRIVKDQAKGTSTFTSEPKLSDSFPWMFLPPNKIVEKLNRDKLKPWLTKGNQRMVESYIEGNTLFLRLCPVSDPTCK